MQQNLKDMLTTTISDFRKDTGVVIMSLDEYNSLYASQHELPSKINEKKLDSAIEKLKSRDSFQKDFL